MDLHGGLLVIGAPGANKVYIYERIGNSWSSSAEINGAGYGNGEFRRAAVAVWDDPIYDNDRVVVGAPSASLTYYSTNRGVKDHFVNLGSSGVAHLFKYNGQNWKSNHELLMPGNEDFEETTSTFTAGVTNSNAGDFSLRIYDGGTWHDFNGPIALDLEDHEREGQDLDDNTVQIRLRPRTTVLLNDNHTSGPSDRRLTNESYTQDVIVYFRATKSNAFDSSGREVDMSAWRNALDDATSGVVSPTSIPDDSWTAPDVLMTNQRWGASVDIVDGVVYVGAPGTNPPQENPGFNHVGIYGVAGTVTSKSNWMLQIAGTSIDKAPIVTADYVSSLYRLGSDLEGTSTRRVLAGAPDTPAGSVLVYDGNGLYNWSLDKNHRPTSVSGARVGDVHTINRTGDRLMIGAPGWFWSALG